CAGGVATNTASDAACGDSLYCNGTERCAPSATGADARGCVAGTPPSPPGPSTPCRSYACDEASDSFALTMLPTGAACDDGLSCTTGDQCRASGVCTGTAQTPCPDATSCTGTGALASAIDVPVARVSGAITLGGAPLPSRLASSYAGGFSLMLVSRETEQRHYVAHVNYSGSSSTLQAGSDRL